MGAFEDVPTQSEIEGYSPNEFKTYENLLRRAAARQGYKLSKSRARDPRAVDFGTYMLVDIEANAPSVYGLTSGYGLTVREIHIALLGRDVHVDYAAPGDSRSMTFDDTDGEPILHYRSPDGWVLLEQSGDEYLTGVVDLDVNEAVERAREHLRG